MTKTPDKKGNRLVILVWIAALIVLWELGAAAVAATKRTPQNVLPHLHQIAQSVVSKRPVAGGKTAFEIVLTNAGITLSRAAVGFLIGTAAGFALALLMRLAPPVEKTLFPYLMMILMVPILGMAPIVLAITRDIDKSRIVIAAILTFYPVATSTLAGMKSPEKEKYDLMRSLAASKWQLYTKLLIPASIPSFFTGLKISAPMAVTASILVDTLQGSGGLGTMLSQSLKLAMSVYVFWQIVFFSAAVGILSTALMSLIEKIVSPQMRAGRSV